MKKSFKKIFASLLAATLMVAGLSLPTAVSAEGETIAYLSFADGGWQVQYWDDGNDYSPVVATTAEVTGYGTYTVGLDFSAIEGGAPDIAFFDVEISNGEAAFPNSYMTIDSVKINGEEVAINGTTYTSSDDDVDTRTNLYNTWVNDEAALAVENARTADGSNEGITAAPIDGASITGIQTIEVTFTLGDGVLCNPVEEEGAAAPVNEFDPNGTYHAYLCVQTPTWIFRDSFDNANYGLESGYFGELGYIDGSDWVAQGGTFTDVEITGNGTYTVALNGYDFSGLFNDQAILGADGLFNLLYVSTDLPVNDAVVISNVVVKMDGKEIATRDTAFLDPDSAMYQKVLLANIWNDAVEALPYYAAPTTSIEITFDVSGFANDAVATDTAPETTPADAAPAESSNNTMVIVIVIVAVVVVIAVVAGVVVSKKKKSAK